MLTVVSGLLLGTLFVTAFGQGATREPSQALPGPASRLLPVGPPTPLTVALHSGLRIQLPIAQSRVTAIGYHSADDGALAVAPVGRQGNQGLVQRVFHAVFGGDGGHPVWYQLDGGPTSALDVGAAPGTDVYSPVDGTVVGISPYVVAGRHFGSRIDIQPQSAPSLVVSLTQLRADRSLTIGSNVVSGRSKIGSVVNLAAIERQALARYTNDAGNHVSVEIRPAATLVLN